MSEVLYDTPGCYVECDLPPITYADWKRRLIALAEFLKQYSRPDERVHVYAYVSETIGGLRITELSFCTRHGGASYMLDDDPDGGAMALYAAEQFLETFGRLPTRPSGWQSFLNLHGESRCRLLRALGCKEAAAADYQLQLQEEHELEKQGG